MRVKNHTVIITVAIIKGGSGKTTTSMALAELLHKRGEQVTVLDSDNTGGATMWEMYVEQENRRRRQDNPDAKPYTLGFPRRANQRSRIEQSGTHPRKNIQAGSSSTPHRPTREWYRRR